MKQYHRPARWAQIFERDGAHRLAIGLPGHAPSPEARQLATSPTAGALPPGCWHVSDHSAPLLAATPPVISDAVHVASGARFRLLSVPDGPIVGLSPEDAAAGKLILAAWSDPSDWANRQRWRIVPPMAPSATTDAPYPAV
jgi:hypothetical protein